MGKGQGNVERWGEGEGKGSGHGGSGKMTFLVAVVFDQHVSNIFFIVPIVSTFYNKYLKKFKVFFSVESNFLHK